MADNRDDDVDREAPTPKITGSFMGFHADSERLARRFAEIVYHMEFRNKNQILRDLELTDEARRFSKECDDMSKRFAAWPTMHAETVALERPILVTRLLELNRQCEEMAIKAEVPPARR